MTSQRTPSALLAYKALGYLALVLAFIGAILPIMPTVPFLIVAAWAFERGSPRLHRWLHQHPLFGPPLRNWNEHGVIPRYAKALALISMSFSVVLMLFMGTPILVVFLVAVIMLTVGIYIVTRPSTPR